MLIQKRSNLLNKIIVLNKNATFLVKINTTYKDKGTQNGILSLKSPDIFQTSNLTEG